METTDQPAPRPITVASSRLNATLLAVSAFTACVFLRAPQLFTGPRLWVEEGSAYYSNMQHLPFRKAITFVLTENYQFATDLLVVLALAVRPRYAAAVTTYLSLLVACWCCVLIARFMAERACSRASIAVACGFFALQMPGYEVLLNATNVMWVCSAVTLFLFLAEDVPAATPAAFGRYLAVAALGMTGVTSGILLPVAAAIALRCRSRARGVMLAVLAAATVAQVAIVLAHASGSSRSYSISVASLVALALQGVLNGLLPASSLDAIGGQLVEPEWYAPAVEVQLVLVGALVLAAIAAAALGPLGRFRTGVLAATAVYATLVNEFGALGSVGDFLSSYGGSRYFFLASTCVIVMLASGLNAASAWARRTSGALALVFASNAVLAATASPLPAVFFKGRSFAAQVDACVPGRDCAVSAWPEGDWNRFTVGGDRLR